MHRAQQPAIRTAHKGIAPAERRKRIGRRKRKFQFVQLAPNAGKHFLPCRVQPIVGGMVLLFLRCQHARYGRSQIGR